VLGPAGLDQPMKDEENELDIKRTASANSELSFEVSFVFQIFVIQYIN
jgi:hypothetical protein